MPCSRRCRRGGDSPAVLADRLVPSYVVAPAYLRDAHRLLETLRHELAAVREEEALAAAQPAHRIRHQYLAAVRLRGDARRQDHGRPKQITVLFDRLAGVEADADGERLSLAISEGALHCHRALDRLRYAAERRHEAIAHRF